MRLESFEARVLPAAVPTAEFDKGILQITGTGDADRLLISVKENRVSISPLKISTQGGAVDSISINDVVKIDLRGAAGNDYLEIDAALASKSISINGGAGADTILFSAGATIAKDKLDTLITWTSFNTWGYTQKQQFEMFNNYRDQYGYVVEYADGTPQTIGEATYFTAVAVNALATEASQTSDKVRLSQINVQLVELLKTLTTKSWGRDASGKEAPIRHPDDWDYIKQGSEYVKYRQSPLTKDSMGQIVSGAYYAFTTPKTSSAVKAAARNLLEKWMNYLIANQWKLATLETVTVYSESGEAKTSKPEAYILLPHERYAFQNVASKMGFVTAQWRTWDGIDSTLIQASAEYIASYAGQALDGLLKKVGISVPYSFSVGGSGWKLVNVSGNISVSISDSTRASIVNRFATFIRESVRVANVSSQADQLLGRAIDSILSMLPDTLNTAEWRNIVTTGLGQIAPWLTGGSWIEFATFASTMQMMKEVPSDLRDSLENSAVAMLASGNVAGFTVIRALLALNTKADLVGYSFWTFTAEMEARPDMANLLRPVVQDFYAYLRGNGNANGLWAWLSGDTARTQEYLRLFEAQSARMYADYAWHREATEFFTRNDVASAKSAPRLDYLVLRGLHGIGAPKGATAVVESWINQLKDGLNAAILRIRDLIRTELAKGVSALENVARFLSERLSIGATDIVKSLHSLGAGLGDITSALWNGVSGLTHSAVAAALWSGVQGITRTSLATAIYSGIPGINETQVAAALWRGVSGTTAASLATALWGGIGGLTRSKVAGAIFSGAPGTTLTQIAEALWTGIANTTRADVAGAIWGGISGVSRSNIAQALWNGVSGTTTSQVAAALWNGVAGTTRSLVAGALWSGIGISRTGIASALWLGISGTTRSDVANALWNGVGGKLSDVANAVFNGIGGTTKALTASAIWNGIGGIYRSDVANALWNGVGGSLADISGALWNGIGGTTRSMIAGALWNGIGGITRVNIASAIWNSISGTNRSDIANALWYGVGGRLSDIAGALWAGIPSTNRTTVAASLWQGIGGIYRSDVAGAIWNGISGTTRSDIASALWNGISGTTRSDIASALWSGVSGTTKTNVATALWNAIGGNLTQVATALWNGIGGTLSSIASAIWNGIGGLDAGNVAYALWHGCSGISAGGLAGALIDGLGLSYAYAWSLVNGL